jgi:hypothetical protein
MTGNREATLKVRLSAEELATVGRAAKENDSRPSTWARERLLSEAARTRVNALQRFIEACTELTNVGFLDLDPGGRREAALAIAEGRADLRITATLGHELRIQVDAVSGEASVWIFQIAVPAVV